MSVQRFFHYFWDNHCTWTHSKHVDRSLNNRTAPPKREFWAHPFNAEWESSQVFETFHKTIRMHTKFFANYRMTSVRLTNYWSWSKVILWNWGLYFGIQSDQGHNFRLLAPKHHSNTCYGIKCHFHTHTKLLHQGLTQIFLHTLLLRADHQYLNGQHLAYEVLTRMYAILTRSGLLFVYKMIQEIISMPRADSGYPHNFMVNS